MSVPREVAVCCHCVEDRLIEHRRSCPGATLVTYAYPLNTRTIPHYLLNMPRISTDLELGVIFVMATRISFYKDDRKGTRGAK